MRLRLVGSRTIAGLFVAIFFVGTFYFFVSSDSWGKTSRITSDARYYYSYLPTLLLDGDLDFENQYQQVGNWHSFGKTPIGRRANVFGVGQAVMSAPGWLVGRAISSSGNGFGGAQEKGALLMSWLFGFATIFLMYTLCSRYCPNKGQALYCSVVAFAGTSLVYYALRQPGYAHPACAFWMAWAVERWDYIRRQSKRTTKQIAVVAFLIGCAALTRPQAILWSLLLLPWLVEDFLLCKKDGLWGRRASTWFITSIALFFPLLPHFVVTHLLYGTPFVTPQGSGFMRWADSLWWETWFSPRNGLFSWSPIALFGILGLVLAVKRQKYLGWLILMFLI